MKYKFHLVNKKIVFQGYHHIELLEFSFDKFTGGQSRVINREVFSRKPCVGIIPYDPKRKEIILIEQIRPGPISNKQSNPWLLEIVAGIIDDNEDPNTSALREAKEEANCNITQLIPIYEYYVSPGCSNETITIYCGITDTSNSGGIHGLSDEDEDIKVYVVKLEEAVNLLASGKIINAATIIAIQWLAINHHKFS